MRNPEMTFQRIKSKLDSKGKFFIDLSALRSTRGFAVDKFSFFCNDYFSFKVFIFSPLRNGDKYLSMPC